MRLFLLFLFCASATAFGGGAQDVMIRDCGGPGGVGGDNGNSPSPCGVYPYVSPDVWLRTQPDGLTNQFDDVPVSNNPAYIYVRLKNIGSSPSCCGTLHLYFRDASTGLSTWPTHWVNFWQGGSLRGDEIGTLNVCNIQPGQDQIVMIMWPSVPDNQTTGSHHCLLARWESACDPMQVTEGPSTMTNVLYNNNIVHHNCHPTKKGSPPKPVAVFNAKSDAVRSALVFDARANDDGRTVFDIEGMRVKVVLDEDLWEQWDGTGENIDEVIDDERAVIISNVHAVIDGLDLPGAEGEDYTNFVVNVEVLYPDNIPDEERGNVYRLTMEQHDEGEEIPDGMGFDIHMTDEDDAGGKRVIPANILGETLKLSARPNISTGSSVISYILPTETRITLAIYDASGSLVRTLVANEAQAGGGHEVNWDGTSTGGAKVASGTYFYRLVTPEGTAEKQIKIVR